MDVRNQRTKTLCGIWIHHPNVPEGYFLLRFNITRPAPISTTAPAAMPIMMAVELSSDDLALVVTATFVSEVVSG